MDISESHQWQKSRALVQTYLLTSSVLPPPTAGVIRGIKTPLRLPSLVAKGPRRRSSMAHLSLSEPSLVSPKENNIFEGFPSNRRPSVLQRRPPPPPPPPPFFKTSQPHQQQKHHHQVQRCSRSTYMHFSQAVQPSSKPRPARRHSHNPALSSEMGDLRPLAMQCQSSSSEAEPLSVVGKPCLLNSTVASAAGPGRAQLHVFLPTGEGEEVDSESVDEGFMDELDSKITSLKLQQGKTATYD